MRNPFERNSARIALAVSLALGIACGAPSVRAEDIDIFVGSPSTAAKPNVLIILDSSANWSASISESNCSYDDGSGSPKATSPNKEQGTKMAIEKCALYNLIYALDTDKYNVGLMLFNESPASNSGGYPRQAIVSLDSSNKTQMLGVIRNLAINGDKGNNAAFSKSLYEAYLYLTGKAPYKGTAGAKYDSAAISGGKYVLPSSSSCSNHVIFIANGSPGEVTDNEAKALLAAAGGDTTKLNYPTSIVTNSDQSNWADEFTRFMNAEAAITTHAVAVTGASSDGKYPNFIENMAAKGGGVYKSASNSADLKDALETIFNKVQAQSSVFASASLPVSVNARGTYLNQVFMGMFLPDAQARPRWVGNLKQYHFSYNDTTRDLKLVDAAGNDAIAIEGGFIDEDAISYWTSSSSFWVNAPSGDPMAISNDPEDSSSDSPDGDLVAKGGAAQVLREDNLTDQDDRVVYTCVSCANDTALGGSGTLFAGGNSSLTQAMFGVSSSGDLEELIDWVRGTDNAGDEKGPGEIDGETVTVRPSIHGDVVHSRPAVVNYGDERGVVIFYGANDGMLHAVHGEQTAADGGRHLWSFVPEEMFSKLKRLRDNSPLISFPTLTTSEPTAARDYFLDGPVSVYQKVSSGGATDKVYLYVGMRRGGRLLYAFDVTTPDEPVFLWKKTSSDISVLGQTWSEARVIKMKGHSNPVIIMGAGYDAAAEDVEPTGTVTMGNAVLLLDATDGALLKQFDTERPVPADVSVVDSDYDGYVDRAYAVDLGGKIYRIDLETSTASSEDVWTMRDFADLGSSGGKKFFYPPDVVLTKNYSVVLVGSGDREKPLESATQDYFYTLIDDHTEKLGEDETVSTIVFSDLVAQAGYSSASDKKGCYIALAQGEKVVNAPLTIAGKTYFSTNQPTPPDASSCSANLGLAKSYSLPLVCKEPTATELEGGGLPPSPVAGVVEVTYTNADGEEETRHVPFIIGGDNEKQSPIEGSRVEIEVTPKRSKIYWYTESER